jgi:hypothetical protein
MMADMVGKVQTNETDLGKDSAKVHLIKPHAGHPGDIVACYQEGVGSDSTFLEYLWDGATASTIGEECIGVYRFIVEHYTDEHEIWLFGFSRGSFTCRCVAGMINNCGIMKRRKGELSDDDVGRLCYDIFRKYRSNLPSDAPKSDSCNKLRGDADKIWQVRQPIRCMSLIDTVGALGIPRLSAGIGLDWGPLEFFDQRVSSSVQYTHHAVSLHDRLWAFQPCLIFPSDCACETVVSQRWFPGTHYDLGRQAFRFLRQSPSNKLEAALGWLPNLLSRTIYPNEVLGDNVLKWLLEGILEVGGDINPIIPDLQGEIRTVAMRLTAPLPNSTGSGDVYSNVLDYAPAGRLFAPIKWVFSFFTSALNAFAPKLGDNIQDLLGIRTILGILLATVDRRIPGVAADVDTYQINNIQVGQKTFSIEELARMKEKDDKGNVRYPSRSYESFLLWKEVFGLETAVHRPLDRRA